MGGTSVPTPIAEAIIFSDKDVQITSARVAIRGIVYPFEAIKACSITKRQSWRVAVYAICFCIGIYFRQQHLQVAWAVFWGISALSFYLESVRPSELILDTSNGHRLAMASADRNYLKTLKTQIDKVLKSRSSPG